MNDEDDIEHIEMTTVPVGFHYSEHVAPIPEESTGQVKINRCTRCHSMGASNYPDQPLLDDFTSANECNFCTSPVDMEYGVACWEPTYEKVIINRWLARPRVTKKANGGKWKIISISSS